MDTTISIRPAGLEDINTIGFLAQEIWPVTYGDILSPAQLQYMLNLFYSPASLKRQILDDKHSFLMVEEIREDLDEPLGFASWSPLKSAGIFKLHKLYVLPGRQGKGMGKTILEYIVNDIAARGGRILQLHVNRHNAARGFYERLGFVVIREEDTDIGNNYFMNDYLMELKVPIRS